MTAHLFKNRHKLCACRWCGRRGGDCAVSESVRDRLALFASDYGRHWKRILRETWEAGKSADEAIQQARNVIGPSGLDRITDAILDHWRESRRNASRAAARSLGAEGIE